MLEITTSGWWDVKKCVLSFCAAIEVLKQLEMRQT